MWSTKKWQVYYEGLSYLDNFCVLTRKEFVVVNYRT